MDMIQVIDLTKKFGDFTANEKINITVEKQEIKCIVGENGAGKTTLMNMLYGLLIPTSGKIFINGEEVILKSPLDAIKKGIGMVHQHFKLAPSLTVYENVVLGNEINIYLGKNKIKTPFINNKEEIKKIEELIKKYNLDLNVLDKIEDISVGGRQRVEILKMLYRNANILILDEPTAVLTPQEVDELMDNLKELKKQGKTIIIITHKLREVMEVSDSIEVIKQGKIVASLKTKDTNETEIAQMMVGRDVVLTVKNDNQYSEHQENVYSVENLCTVNEYGKEVVKDVSFSICKGEILGIAGVEGNGQSEIVKMITGLMECTKGKVMFKNEDITCIWPNKLRKIGIGIIPEDRYAQGICKDISIADNFIAGNHTNKEICKYGFLNYKKIFKKRDKLIEKYDIRIGNVNGNASELSGGNAQKIIIAREIESNPDILIACQPTRGVDIGSIEFIHKKLLEFRNKGKSIILISSELSEILSLSDRVIIMYKGSIAGEVLPKETTREKVGLLMAGIK